MERMGKNLDQLDVRAYSWYNDGVSSAYHMRYGKVDGCCSHAGS